MNNISNDIFNTNAMSEITFIKYTIDVFHSYTSSFFKIKRFFKFLDIFFFCVCANIISENGYFRAKNHLSDYTYIL